MQFDGEINCEVPSDEDGRTGEFFSVIPKSIKFEEKIDCADLGH